MVMEKLSCHMNWSRELIEEYFDIVEVVPGQSINYYGMGNRIHITVHSIPAIGRTFVTTYKGLQKKSERHW